MEDDSYALYRLALEAVELGNEDEALGLLRKSLSLAPHFKTYHRIALILQRRGELKEAGQHLKAGYVLNPRNDRIACDYAIWLLEAGQDEEARDVIDALLLRNDSYGPAKEVLKRLREVSASAASIPSPESHRPHPP